MTKTDELIKKDVIEQLVRDDRIDASGINVEVSDGTVTLRGEVPTYFSKTAAFEDTLGILGVRNVINQLQVNYPSSVPIPTDMEIEKSMINRLAANPDIDLLDLEVIVSAGRVTLRGTVDAYWKKKHAEYLASTEPGVVSIENLIAVVPTEDVLDKTIAEDIIDTLESKALVDPDEVNVKVRDGEVTLTGSVSSWMARRAAGEAAFFTSGVTNVENRVGVSGV